MQGAWVLCLARKLRCHMLCGAAETKQKKYRLCQPTSSSPLHVNPPIREWKHSHYWQFSLIPLRVNAICQYCSVSKDFVPQTITTCPIPLLPFLVKYTISPSVVSFWASHWDSPKPEPPILSLILFLNQQALRGQIRSGYSWNHPLSNIHTRTH